MLKPKDHAKSNAPLRRTCEHAKGKEKKQREKQEFYARNTHLKWNDR